MRTIRVFCNLFLLALLPSVSVSVHAQADTAANKALLVRYTEEYYNQRKWDVGSEIFAQDVIMHQPAAPDTVGLEAFTKGYQNMTVDWPDGKVTPIAQIAEGDYVATAYTWEATFSKPIANANGELKPTGKKVLMNATMLVHIKDGKIAEEWKMWDAWNVFQQMGAVPAQGDLPVIKPWTMKLGSVTTSSQDFKKMVAEGFKTFPKTILVGDIAADYALHSPPSLGVDGQGFAAYAQWTKQYLSLFPDMTLTGSGGKGDYLMVTEGDLVAILYTAQAHFTQDMMGIKANGAALTIPGLSMLRIKDGQLAEFWVNIDTASMMTQMLAPAAK